MGIPEVFALILACVAVIASGGAAAFIVAIAIGVWSDLLRDLRNKRERGE